MKEEKHTFITEDGRVFVEADYLQFSDYSGSTVERSNVEWLQKHFGKEIESPCWRRHWPTEEIDEPEKDTLILELHYDYSGVGLFVLDLEKSDEKWHTDRAKELQEIIDALSDYPLIDDEAHSRLEYQLQEEYLADEIQCAMRYLSRSLGKEDENAESWSDWWDSLSADEEEKHIAAMIERFPCYHEPSGEMVCIFETGCVPYCRHFDGLFRETFYSYVAEIGLAENGEENE